MTNSIEKEYLSKQISYWNEQYILSSFTKEELKKEIFEMKNIYKIERDKLLLIYKERVLMNDYINGSEMDKYFIRTLFNTFYGGVELNLYKEQIGKFNMYYRINHMELYKGNSYIPFNMASTKIKDVIGSFITLPSNTRGNLRCMLSGHNDSSPSFKIYENTNSWWCFGCSRGGNPANFIAEFQGITYKEGFKTLIHMYK